MLICKNLSLKNVLILRLRIKKKKKKKKFLPVKVTQMAQPCQPCQPIHYICILVKTFSLEEAVEAGLVDTSALPDKETPNELENKQFEQRKTKRPSLAQYSVIKSVLYIYNSRTKNNHGCKKIKLKFLFYHINLF